MRDGRAGDEEHALHVGVEDEVPLLLRHVRDVAHGGRPRAVDDDVEPSEGIHGVLDETGHALGVADVEPIRSGLDTVALEVGDRAIELVAFQAADRHPRAFRTEREARRRDRCRCRHR